MLRRLYNLIRAFFGRFLTAVERDNPEALLELEVENLRAQIARYNQGLISHAALCERLLASVKRLESERVELQSKIKANLAKDNRAAAGQYALRLKTVETDLEENRAQSVHAETTYKELTHGRDVSVGIAKARIDALKANIDDLKMRQAVAELSEMAAGLVADIGGSGDTFDRLSKMVEEESIKAAGKARVAKDSLHASGVVQERAEEQAAMAEEALQEYQEKEN